MPRKKHFTIKGILYKQESRFWFALVTFGNREFHGRGATSYGAIKDALIGLAKEMPSAEIRASVRQTRRDHNAGQHRLF